MNDGAGRPVRKIDRKLKIVLWVLCGLILLNLGILYLSAKGLGVSRYEISTPKIAETIRIVQLTDLHNSEFGKDNKRLIRKVTGQKPDLILITGDLLNQREERTDIAEELIRSLSEIAPVYVSFGNHELGYQKKYGNDLRTLYTQAGATVLNFNWTAVTIRNQTIRLGGLYGYCVPLRYLERGEASRSECEFLQDFEQTADLKLLLCHMPLCWIMMDSLDSWNIDLVLCGHVHGGQVRIPFVGGLWAPDQGWFPGKESGLYQSADGTKQMVLSRGLGSTETIPRFNNIPEIVVLDLVPMD